MSSAVVSTSAAQGRHFVFDDEAEAEVRSCAPRKPSGMPESQESAIARFFQSSSKNQQSKIPPASVTPAAQLEIRPAPEMASSGIPAIDALTGGLPRGCLSEICGPASSGRTTVLLAALAAATRREEFCAVVDASDALDPHSVSAAGVDLDRLLWVRCGERSPKKSNSPQRYPSTSLRAGSGTGKRVPIQKNSELCLEQVLRATDLLLESGGFGMIVLDLGDLPVQAARRIPLTTWFRFRRAVEYKPTILLTVEQQPIAGSCASLRMRMGVSSSQFSVFDSQNTALPRNSAQAGKPSHAQLLTGLEITAELVGSRLERKPPCSIRFASKTAWAG